MRARRSADRPAPAQHPSPRSTLSPNVPTGGDRPAGRFLCRSSPSSSSPSERPAASAATDRVPHLPGGKPWRLSTSRRCQASRVPRRGAPPPATGLETGEPHRHRQTAAPARTRPAPRRWPRPRRGRPRASSTSALPIWCRSSRPPDAISPSKRPLAKLDRFDLIILDDISYARKDQAETSVLFFELIARRYETRSLAIAARN